jgi:hemolysin III
MRQRGSPTVREDCIHNGGRSSQLEELANSLTHGFGLVLSLAGVPILITLALRYGTAWHIVSCAIYGATLVALYGASTLYHGVRRPGAKKILRIVDHSAIYLVIAGTYTPFALVTLRGTLGWTLFGIVWAVALSGIVFKIFFVGRFAIWSTAVYVVLGWLAIVAIKPLLATFALYGIVLLVAGGVAYTAGVIFFAWERLRYSHAIWHLFVLSGSILHYLAVALYVVPVAASA